MLAFGDITEWLLRSCGITKTLVQTVTGKKDCGCSKRREAMNRFGYRVQHRLLMFAYWTGHRWELLRHSRTVMRLKMASKHFYYGFRVLFYGR